MQLSANLDYLRPQKAELTRVGPQGDGGYVIPKQASTQIRSLYSVGISNNWDFEIQMAKLNPGMKIYAFDRTSGWQVFAFWALRDIFKGDPSATTRQSVAERFKSARKYLLLSLNFRSFFIGRRKFRRRWVKNTKNSGSEISLKQSLSKVFGVGSTMIKIDIEGGEYELSAELISQIKQNERLIDCIVMEFHDTVTKRTEFETIVKGISNLFPIVHIHGNNCAGIASDGLPEVLEITFARSSCDEGNTLFPLQGLDCPNDKEFEDLSFSFSLQSH
jgi:hypothetical protein